MANEYAVNKSDLTSVASAIRTKGGTSASLKFPSGFVSAIQSIKTGESPRLIITAQNGSSITATNGAETVTGVVGSSGTLTLDLPTFGTWTVTATLNGTTIRKTIDVTYEFPADLSGSITFTVNGGHGETIRVYKDGVSAGTVALNAEGTGSIHLTGCSGKTIRFVGATSGYERSISAGSENQISVNVFPDGAIYWYGREFVDKTGGWVAKPNASYTATLTKQQNYMVMKSTNSGSSGLVGIGIANAMNLSKYKTMKIKVGNNPASTSTQNKFGITSKYDASNWPNLWVASKTFGAAGEHSLSFSSSTGFPLFQIWPSSTFAINSVVFE
jgi:hypothetical protein